MKRFLSLTIALLMIFSMCAVCVSAESDYYDPKQFVDLSKSEAGSIYAAAFVLDKLFDGTKYGDMGNCWHTKTGLSNDEAGRTATIMFTQEIEVAGIRIYPRTINGAANPTSIRIIGIYSNGEKEITVGEFPFVKKTVANPATEENIEKAPKSVLFPQSANKKMKGIKIVLLKDTSGGAGHFNFTELELLKPGAKADSVGTASTGTTTTPTTTTTTTTTPSVGTAGNGGYVELSTTGWKATASSTNANNGVPCEVPERAFDGNVKTHWQTMINPKAPYPHHITIELPSEQEIDGYRYFPRPDHGVGVVLQYEILVSTDGTNFTKVAEGNWKDDTETKDAYFGKTVKAKFVKLLIKKGSIDFGSAAEIRLLKKSGQGGTSAPAVGTTTPAAGTGSEANVTVNPKTEGAGLKELATTGWKATASSTNANGGVPCEVPERAFDGNLSTHWQTMISPKAPLPHYFTIELPSQQEFSGFRYFPRPDYGVGIVKEYEIHVSDDGTTFYKVAAGLWADNIETKTCEFKYNVKAKFVKLVIYAGSIDFGSAAEIRLLSASSAKKTLPLTDYPIGVVEGERKPMSETSKSAEDELEVTGWTFDASSVNANNGVPCEKAEFIADGNMKTHWQTMINPKAPYPHHITIILPEPQAISGYRYYPRPDRGAGIVLEYELHLSEDGENFVSVARGVWKDDIEIKEVELPVNIVVKAVKLVVNKGSIGFASAAEIRLLKPVEKKETVSFQEYTSNMGDFNLVEAQYEGMKVKATGKIGDPNVNMREIPTNMTDGIVSSYWQAKFEEETITVDFFFPYAYTIKGLRYVPKQSNTTGHFQEFDIYSSNDGKNFELFGSYKFEEANKITKDIFFDEKPFSAKQMRIVVKKATNGYASASDIYFLQNENELKEETTKDLEKYVLKIGSNEIQVTKGDETKVVTMDVAPFILSGSTVIPLRGLLEEMGAIINWIADEQKIEVFTRHFEYMLFQIENERVYIDGIRYSTPVAPLISGGRTFIPLRFISENMGYKVNWNGATQEITITNK